MQILKVRKIFSDETKKEAFLMVPEMFCGGEGCWEEQVARDWAQANPEYGAYELQWELVKNSVDTLPFLMSKREEIMDDIQQKMEKLSETQEGLGVSFELLQEIITQIETNSK